LLRSARRSKFPAPVAGARPLASPRIADANGAAPLLVRVDYPLRRASIRGQAGGAPPTEGESWLREVKLIESQQRGEQMDSRFAVGPDGRVSMIRASRRSTAPDRAGPRRPQRRQFNHATAIDTVMISRRQRVVSASAVYRHSGHDAVQRQC